MAFTVIVALFGAMILSVTFIPAAVALFFQGRLSEKENILMKWAKKGYTPILNLAMHNRAFVVTTASVLVVLSGLLATRMGSEFYQV